MTVRAGMTGLIAELRILTSATEGEYALGAVSYWTDEQLQDVLDRHRLTVVETLKAHPEQTGAGTETRRHTFAASHVETAESGAEAWRLAGRDGHAPNPAGYRVDYAAREVIFAADTGGAVYTLRCRTYDLQRAAAAVWEAKAAHVSARFDIRTDNHELKRSQLQQSYLTMAARLRAAADADEMAAAPRHVRMVRSDVR